MNEDGPVYTCEKCGVGLVDPGPLRDIAEGGTVVCEDHRHWGQREGDGPGVATLPERAGESDGNDAERE